MAIEVTISGSGNTAVAIPGPAYEAYAQSFPSGSGFNLESISLDVAQGAGNPGTVYCQIFACDGSDFPTGLALGTASVSASSLNTYPSYTYNVFTFSPAVTLSASTQYCFKLSTSSGVWNTDYIFFATNGGNTYASGLLSRYDGGSWSDATNDCPCVIRSSDLPSKPTSPTPSNGATEVDFSGLQLSWSDGGNTDDFDVYIGTTGNPTLVSSAQAGTTYTTTLAELATIFGSDPIDQVIYWRVDANNSSGTTTGDEWNFDARPGKASSPSPANAATDEAVYQQMSWTAGSNATTYSTYADLGSGLALQSSGISGVTWTPSTSIFGYITQYTWRVDSVNSFGTTTGDSWTFTTLRFDPPSVTYDGYYLLIKSGDVIGTHPSAGGVQNTDYVVTTNLPNFIHTNRALVAAANNKIWYEDVP